MIQYQKNPWYNFDKNVRDTPHSADSEFYQYSTKHHAKQKELIRNIQGI